MDIIFIFIASVGLYITIQLFLLTYLKFNKYKYRKEIEKQINSYFLEEFKHDIICSITFRKDINYLKIDNEMERHQDRLDKELDILLNENEIVKEYGILEFTSLDKEIKGNFIRSVYRDFWMLRDISHYYLANEDEKQSLKNEITGYITLSTLISIIYLVKEFSNYREFIFEVIKKSLIGFPSNVLEFTSKVFFVTFEEDTKRAL